MLAAEPSLEADLDALRRENDKLRKINAVLMERVENVNEASGSAFALFQRAILLEETVRERTAELRAANVALAAARREADDANAGKTKFLASAGHDLMQPLHAARLFVSALEGTQPEERTLELVRRIDSALSDAEHLLSTTLEISHLDAGTLSADLVDVALAPLMRKVGDEAALDAEARNLRLRTVTAGVVVRTDPQLLGRVLRNFLSNAVRYTTRGGIVFGARVRANACRIEVWDTGAGIPHDRLRDVFEEFRRLDVPGSASDGMGLGLAIVERIAPLIGARIDVRSRLGRGSVFAIEVPLGDPARVADAMRTARREGNLLAGKIAVVIDDDASAREAMVALLRGWDCLVHAASGTHEARALAGAGAVDFVVADYHLGERDTGIDAVDAVRARTGIATPAAIVTAHDDRPVREHAAAHGLTVLSKPVRPDRLRALINNFFS